MDFDHCFNMSIPQAGNLRMEFTAFVVERCVSEHYDWDGNMSKVDERIHNDFDLALFSDRYCNDEVKEQFGIGKGN